MKIEQNPENTKIVIDTYAWIEYFRGSAEGKKAANFIDDEFTLLTPAIVIAELSDKFRRSGLSRIWEDERIIFIGVKSEIISIDQSIADRAGKIKLERRIQFKDFGLGDALVLAVAEQYNAKLLTGDKHLKTEKITIDITK